MPEPERVRVLYEQVHVLRARIEAIDTDRTIDKQVGYVGSGISVLIPSFNRLLARAHAFFQEDPSFSDDIAGITSVEGIEERLHPTYHRVAKQRLLLGADMLLQALGARVLAGERIPPLRVEREGIFVPGQHFDALLHVAELMFSADTHIVIIDGYINHKILDLLRGKREAATVQILTKPNAAAPLHPLLIEFNKQYGQKGPLSLRASDSFHDRFLILDEKDFYHFGASLGDLGKRGFMFSRVEEPAVLDVMRRAFAEAWAKAATS